MANQRREGIHRQEQPSRSAILGQGPASTSTDTSNGIFELFTEVKIQNELWTASVFFIPEKTTRLKETEKLIKRLSETRLKYCRPCTHRNLMSWAIPLPSHCYENSSSNPPGLGYRIFNSRSLLCPPLPNQHWSCSTPLPPNFTQNSVSEDSIWHQCKEAKFLASVIHRVMRRCLGRSSQWGWRKTRYWSFYICVSTWWNLPSGLLAEGKYAESCLYGLIFSNFKDISCPCIYYSICH